MAEQLPTTHDQAPEPPKHRVLRFTRDLLSALADSSPAFRRPPSTPVAPTEGPARRLMRALADDYPAANPANRDLDQ